MNEGPRPPTPDWTVFKLLWKSARKRGAARSRRQKNLLNNRTGSGTDALGCLMTCGMIVITMLVHGILGWILVDSVKMSATIEAGEQGRMVVPDTATSNLEKLRELEREFKGAANDAGEKERLKREIFQESNSLANASSYWRGKYTGNHFEDERKSIIAFYDSYGSGGFVAEGDLFADLLASKGAGYDRIWVLPSIVLFWWTVMLIAQGEGLELDVQRRHHPLWEWLFSHPVRPVAAFSAEMLSPLMANPIYFTAPVFWFMFLKEFQPTGTAILLAVLIGLPLAVAASVSYKSIEIAAMLRLNVRTRGAVLGLLSWVGYVAMLLPLFTLQMESAKASLVKVLEPLSAIPVFTWPAKLVTLTSSGEQWWPPLLLNWAYCGCLLGGAGVLAWRGVARGLQGHGSGRPTVRSGKGGFLVSSRLSNPLYRKELLWLWRDKAAVVQVILIPLTIGLFQAFNLRGIAEMAGSSWNILCGVAILCGTYFLLVLGPRSLASEGGALWIALTWPRGLEDLLKAKARLWWGFSTAIVGLALIGGIFLFPKEWWRIGLVGVGWWFFSRALAEKSVALVTAPTSSGTPEKPKRSRQLAAMLGTLAFGAGVMTQNWHVALLGVIFASLTAAAMWQNLRARLPYLFDQWSEKLPPAPTLMHAMIAIAILGEAVGIVLGVVSATGGDEYLWLARAISYALGGFVVFAATTTFLEGRGVRQNDIWLWKGIDRASRRWTAGLLGFAGGATLGGVALVYLTILEKLPATSEYFARMAEIAASYSSGIAWQLILSVGLAPLAEEFLFRGILYRALDREWGGLRAMIGSAAYFAIYHPPASWVPVFLLGLSCAALFKRTGSLWACVICHAIYNLIVTLWGV